MQNKAIHFKQISTDVPIREVIKEAFGMDMDISGDWGYDAQHAIIIHEQNMPYKQLQHTLASMRAHLEMNMTLPKEERYGGINLTELSRSAPRDTLHEAITYKVTAMLESDYAVFINAYKEGYGTKSFDMEAHFHDREEATLTYKTIVWFQTER